MDNRFQRVTPFLWFADRAEEAAELYTGIFPSSKITKTVRSNGKVLTVAFELDGVPFTALNGGPLFEFSEAVSFVVSCVSQKEVDHFWDALGKGGEFSQCGWLKDRYGLSWQIVPTALPELLGDPDPARADRAMQAMLKMRKLDLAELQRAAAG